MVENGTEGVNGGCDRLGELVTARGRRLTHRACEIRTGARDVD